jgi:hypothetical protein
VDKRNQGYCDENADEICNGQNIVRKIERRYLEALGRDFYIILPES